MNEIVIYTTTSCPYCVKAKAFFKQQGLEYKEVDVTGKDAEREALVAKSGGRKTVPQIFINNKHVGGCDDMIALWGKNKLADFLIS